MQGIVKQLLSLKYECVIDRIIRQCNDRGYFPYVVSWNKDVLRRVMEEFRIETEKTETTSHTFLKTRDYWAERTIILLGDVIYSKATMDGIFAVNKEIAVFGNVWEVFAVAFMDNLWDNVIEALNKSKKHGLGKLRYFYKAYCGFEMDCPEQPGEVLEPVIFRYTYDYTRDIDTLEEYHNVVKELINVHRLDDMESLYR